MMWSYTRDLDNRKKGLADLEQLVKATEQEIRYSPSGKR